MFTEKILVVDDEESVCRSVTKILSRRGYGVSNATSVGDAVGKMNETAFDLVITDLMMPGKNGLDLLRIIQENYPELDVIMITGYASIESAVKATRLGAAGYLPKPFTPEELATVTEKTLRDRKKGQITARPDTGGAAAQPPADDLLDVDLPFSARELISRTSPEYAEALTHSDIPLARKVAERAYCNTGRRECRKVVKDNAECAGECPIENKEKARAVAAGGRTSRRSEHVLDADLPFRAAELEQFVGADYIACLDASGMPRAALYGRGRRAKHSVLVVDDEPVVCQSVRKILAQRGCAVEEAFDMDAALRKMKLGQYDLVVLDLRMPKKSGMETLRAIRKLYPDVAVVMVSGYATIDNAIEAVKQGAFHVLPKPFTPAELSRVAEEALAA